MHVVIYLQNNGTLCNFSEDIKTETINNAMIWTVTLRYNGDIIGEGQAPMRMDAREIAAEKALQNLNPQMYASIRG